MRNIQESPPFFVSGFGAIVLCLVESRCRFNTLSQLDCFNFVAASECGVRAKTFLRQMLFSPPQHCQIYASQLRRRGISSKIRNSSNEAWGFKQSQDLSSWG